jgi:dextranase
MTAATFPDLRTCYLHGEPVRLRQLTAGTRQVIARSAFGGQQAAAVAAGAAELAGLEPGSYAIEAWSADGRLTGEELTTVAAGPGDRPVPGFVSSFSTESVPQTLDWLRELRCTAVQFYDWMASYTEPLATSDDYADRLGRQHSLTAITELTRGCRELGATPQAYAPVYAADPDFARGHPDLLLRRGDGDPQRLGDLLEITDPGNPGWQRHWLRAYGAAADVLGFGGFHLDTYGYPRQPLDAGGRPVPMPAAYASFLAAVRAARPAAVLSFNQVNGVPAEFGRPDGPGYRYLEVWPPNDRWRHLEGLLRRSVPGRPEPGAVLAIYPPVWAADRQAALRTVVLTGAVVTTLGAGMLAFGDAGGCLQHPYYPDYQRLSAVERAEALRWHRFGLRCRDLLAGGTDTSWLDIGDENGAVSVAAVAAGDDAGAALRVLPEPSGGAVYARVVRHEGCIAVSVLDLTGSPAGSWREATGPGRCRAVRVSVLLDRPGEWAASAAVLGRENGRFVPARAERGTHREGSSLDIELPLQAGWSVLRLLRQARPALAN